MPSLVKYPVPLLRNAASPSARDWRTAPGEPTSFASPLARLVGLHLELTLRRESDRTCGRRAGKEEELATPTLGLGELCAHLARSHVLLSSEADLARPSSSCDSTSAPLSTCSTPDTHRQRERTNRTACKEDKGIALADVQESAPLRRLHELLHPPIQPQQLVSCGIWYSCVPPSSQTSAETMGGERVPRPVLEQWRPAR